MPRDVIRQHFFREGRRATWGELLFRLTQLQQRALAECYRRKRGRLGTLDTAERMDLGSLDASVRTRGVV